MDILLIDSFIVDDKRYYKIFTLFKIKMTFK